MSAAASGFHARDVPPELLTVSRWRGAANLARTWAGIALLPWACGQIGSGWAWLLAGIVMSGLQNHLMVLLHHSIHVNLHPSRRVNDALARWLVSGPMAQPWTFMRRAHVQHHARLGQASDPDRWYYDLDLFGRRRPGVLMAWLAVNLCGGLLVPTIRKLVTGRRSPDDPFEEAGTGDARDAASVVVAQLVILGAFWALGGVWWTGIVLWVVPAATLGGGLNCFRTALEHVDAGHPPSRDWSFRSNPLELFFVAPFAMNYHWEHHLLMTVPYYRMQAFRSFLEARGGFEDGVLVGSYVGRLRHVLRELREARASVD